MPEWISYQNISYTKIGIPGNMTCAAKSEPPPKFLWFKGQFMLENDNVYKIVHRKYVSLLQVRNTTLSDLAVYTCIVHNIEGELKVEIHLREGSSPNEPSFVISSEEPGVIAIQINPFHEEDLPIIGYKIQWKLAEEPWNYAKEYITSTGTDLVLRDLDLGTNYTVRVSSYNHIGMSNYTDAKLQETKTFIPETVVDIYGGNVLSSTFSKSSKLTISFFHFTLSYVAFVILVQFFLHTNP